MKARELRNLGVPPQAVAAVGKTIGVLRNGGLSVQDVRARLRAVLHDPPAFVDDVDFGSVAQALIECGGVTTPFVPRDEPAPWRQWGVDLDQASIDQMKQACLLPVAVTGALMPDAHLGYGLPIGGVLGTDNAVIPYAVGVDIACRMKLSVLDLPLTALTGQHERLVSAIEHETRFGIGAAFESPRDHAVLEDDWSASPVTKKHKDKAWRQLGTSGSGNHFVEFGTLTLTTAALGLAADRYVALLSHSGSRGVGASVASHYARLAHDQHPELPKQLRHLAWLDLDTAEGQEYWLAMTLMGAYASANHALIHQHVARRLGAEIVAGVENHHNFAWKEEHGGRELIVHRKGATPAGEGVLGVIPGSMATPGYVVIGKGNTAALHSASHGAGRVMSRRAARSAFTWSEAKKLLKMRGVHLISAGLDEVPMVYKDIETVMAAQRDLVEPLARFDPQIVKMAPEGERAED